MLGPLGNHGHAMEDTLDIGLLVSSWSSSRSLGCPPTVCEDTWWQGVAITFVVKEQLLWRFVFPSWVNTSCCMSMQIWAYLQMQAYLLSFFLFFSHAQVPVMLLVTKKAADQGVNEFWVLMSNGASTPQKAPTKPPFIKSACFGVVVHRSATQGT